MGSFEKKLSGVLAGDGPLPFRDVEDVCTHFFGAPRTRGSHLIYKMPWAGDPRINIQNRGGQVAAYQVRQVAKAIARLEEDRD